ncbi:unnamed protein product [Caenorhabditis nigoni]
MQHIPNIIAPIRDIIRDFYLRYDREIESMYGRPPDGKNFAELLDVLTTLRQLFQLLLMLADHPCNPTEQIQIRLIMNKICRIYNIPV